MLLLRDGDQVYIKENGEVQPVENPISLAAPTADFLLPVRQILELDLPRISSSYDAHLVITDLKNTLVLVDESSPDLQQDAGQGVWTWELGAVDVGEIEIRWYSLHLYSSIVNGTPLTVEVACQTQYAEPVTATCGIEIRNDGHCQAPTPWPTATSSPTITPTLRPTHGDASGPRLPAAPLAQPSRTQAVPRSAAGAQYPPRR